MPSVDNRVVRMDFDNKKFENDVKTTTGSLDKLKQSLKFEGATEGLKKVGTTAKALTFDNITASIDRVRQNVSVMSVAIIASIMNITNRVVNMGVQMAKSLSIAPLMSGFSEYETNMNSIQTVLANTSKQGTTLEQVNAALDKLNTYSDQTIYNFGEMAKNIGTFTAAGVDLDTSVSSIKGIANVAAMSGSNAEQASTAMYQLSQALASGSVKLQDWVSVRNASMGGRVFQEALFTTGKALGTIENASLDTTFDQWTASGTDFAHTLEQGWLTSEVLTKTLTAFTGDLNEEQLVGLGYTKDQAIEFVKLAKTAKDAATVVKTFSQLRSTVKENIGSGWSSSFRIIIGDFEEAKTLFTVTFQAISNVVGPITEARNAMLGAWKAFGGRTVLLQGIIYGLQAIGSVIRAVSTAFRQVFPKKSLTDLLQMTAKFRDFTQSLKPSEETLSNIRSIARGVFSVFAMAISIVSAIGKVFWSLGKSISGTGVLLPLLAKLGDYLYLLRYKLDDGLPKFISKVTSTLNALVAAPILFGIKLITNIFGRIGDRAAQASKGISKLGGVFNWLDEQIQKIPGALSKTFTRGNFDTSVDVVNAGLLGGLIFVLARFFKKILTFDFGTGLIDKLNNIFDQFGNTLKSFQLKVKADAIRSIAISVAIMAGSLALLSLIDSVALMRAVIAMSVMFALMGGMMKFLGSMSSDPKQAKSILMLAAGIAALGLGMLFLAGAMKLFSSMSWQELAKGFIGLGLALYAVTTAMYFMPDEGDLFKAGLGIYFIGKAAQKLAIAVQAFGKMDTKELVQGLLALGAVFGLLVVLMKNMPEKEMLNLGFGVNLIATGLLLMAGVVWLLGNMDIPTLIQGLLAFSVIMGVLALALKSFPKDMDKVGLGVLAISAAMVIMTAAIKILGEMNLLTLVQGIAAIAAVLFILSVAVGVLDSQIVGVKAIIILAAALLVMSVAVKILGSMPIAQLVAAMVAIAVLIAVIAGSATLAAPAVPILTGLATAFLIFGAAILALGIAAILFAKAFDMVRESTTKGMSSIGGAIGVVISKIGSFMSAVFKGLMESIGKFFKALPGLFTKLLSIISNLVPNIIKFVVGLVFNILKAIAAIIPQLVTLVVQIIAAFINAIAANLGTIIEAGANLIIAYIQGIAKALPRVIDAGVDLIIAFIQGIENSVQRIIDAVTALIITVIRTIGENASLIVTAGADMIVNFLKGMSDNIDKVVKAGFQFVLDVLTGIEQSTRENTTEIRNKAFGIIAALISGLTDGLGEKATEFYDKIKEFAKEALDKIKLGWLIHSPSKATKQIAGYLVDGLVAGFSDHERALTAVDGLTSNVTSAFSNALSSAYNTLDTMGNLNPTITPVLDLSNIQNGSKTMNNMFGTPTLGANVSFGKASAISGMQNQNTKNTAVKVSPQVNEIKFEQTINSPVALTTSEIYRNTKTQISMAKEELRLV